MELKGIVIGGLMFLSLKGTWWYLFLISGEGEIDLLLVDCYIRY